MTNDTRERIDDAALDALISQSVRVDAPDGFTVRVGAALDAGQATGGSWAWVRPALAVAAMLLLAAIWWWRQPLPSKSDAPQVAHLVAPGRTTSHPVAPGRNTSHPVAPGRTTSPPVASAFAPPALRRDGPVYVRIDHERALDALNAVAAVQQKVIDPAAIATSVIEVQPADAITPLNVDANGPDPGGQGDH